MGADGDGVVVGMDVVCFWCFFGGGIALFVFVILGVYLPFIPIIYLVSWMLRF